MTSGEALVVIVVSGAYQHYLVASGLVYICTVIIIVIIAYTNTTEALTLYYIITEA